MKMSFRFALAVLTLFSGSAVRAAQGETISARLSGSEEVPVVATVASGEFRGFINRGDQSIDYDFSYSGLQGSVTQAHIHVAQPGVNGGIVIWLCKTTQMAPAGTPNCTPGSGIFINQTITSANVVAVTGTNEGQQLEAGAIDKVIAAIRAGNAYVNVHTDLSPSGEIRGQIRASARR